MAVSSDNGAYTITDNHINPLNSAERNEAKLVRGQSAAKQVFGERRQIIEHGHVGE